MLSILLHIAQDMALIHVCCKSSVLWAFWKRLLSKVTFCVKLKMRAGGGVVLLFTTDIWTTRAIHFEGLFY